MKVETSKFEVPSADHTYLRIHSLEAISYPATSLGSYSLHIDNGKLQAAISLSSLYFSPCRHQVVFLPISVFGISTLSVFDRTLDKGLLSLELSRELALS